MSTSKQSTVEKLKRQRELLNAKIQKAEATEKQKTRKNETRMKILVGSYFLEKYKQDTDMAELRKMLDTFLTRKSDRELFELEVLPE